MEQSDYTEVGFSEINFSMMQWGDIMFFGREKEIDTLKEFLQKNSGSMMIYGKRKVGKTTLINRALENEKNKAYYECIRGTAKENIDGLVRVLVEQRIIPVFLDFSSFQDVFKYLNSLEGTYTIVIDEYPYLKTFEKAATVDSVFQTVIDNYIKNVRLIISGSHIGMMKDMLKEKNALYGRFKEIVQLKELNYRDAAEFYPNQDVYNKIAFYSVFGGSPYINEFINPSKSLKENIVATILNVSHSVYIYADNLLISDLSNSAGAERIFAVLGNGKMKYNEIEKGLRMEPNGSLSKQLNPLLNMEIITKSYPINRPDDAKKTSYEINDNLLRFFYSYVYRNKSALQVIGARAFYKEYVEPSLTTFISKRFEEQCRDYFSIMVKSGKLSGVTNIGCYYYDDSVHQKNGEFDVVVQHRKNKHDFYEVKYQKKPLSLKEINKEIKQLEELEKSGSIRINRIGFISATGFADTANPYDFITGNDLYC